MAQLGAGRILDDAVKDRMMASNPARGVKLPKRPPRRNVYLTPQTNWTSWPMSPACIGP